MSRKKQILMVGGTFAFALGTGFVMQNGDAVASRFSADSPTELLQDLQTDFVQGPTLFNPVIDPPTFALVSETREDAPVVQEPPVQLAALEADPMPGAEILNDATMVAECSVDLDLEASKAAMVNLSITASCLANSQAVVHHKGMMFSLVTDENGQADVLVPALAGNAVYIVSFPSGEAAMGSVVVSDLADFDRAVLQWQGAAGMQLHAREFGADYGSEGHVWASAMGNSDATSGFLTILGTGNNETTFHAEVYTFPSGKTAQSGEVAISVEVEVTEANCGREVIAQSLQVFPDTDAEALDLTMQMPACEGVGDFLVLNNMLRSLTIAAK